MNKKIGKLLVGGLLVFTTVGAAACKAQNATSPPAETQATAEPQADQVKAETTTTMTKENIRE